MKTRVKTLNTTTPLSNISVETLKSAFEASRGPVTITDYLLPDNPIIYANQAFLELTGYTAEDIIGRNCRFLQGKDTVKKGIRTLHNAVADGTYVRTLIKNYKKDGSEFWNDLVITPIKDASGRITHFVGMQLDVTERVVAEERLLAKKKELEESNRELEQFTYAASHDLQEPLRMISSYIQLIDKRYGPTLADDAREFLGFASEGASRMQSLVYDLLTLSRISLTERQMTPVDMATSATRALGNLKLIVSETRAKVSIETLPTVTADPTQMTQLFQNLIGNAIKYRSPKRDPVISITARQTGKSYSFKVSDNGIGIKKQDFERVFVIFQRLHTRSEYEGTGIGLAIVSRIIERHNGRLWVESEHGRGSDFCFSLPAA